MSDNTVLSQVLEKQIANFEKSLGEFSKACTTLVEKFGSISDETETDEM